MTSKTIRDLIYLDRKLFAKFSPVSCRITDKTNFHACSASIKPRFILPYKVALYETVEYKLKKILPFPPFPDYIFCSLLYMYCYPDFCLYL